MSRPVSCIGCKWFNESELDREDDWCTHPSLIKKGRDHRGVYFMDYGWCKDQNRDGKCQLRQPWWKFWVSQ